MLSNPNQKRTLKNQWLLLPIVVLMLSACQKKQQDAEQAKTQALALNTTITNVNSNAIKLGRHSALSRQLAQKWRLTDIDGIMVDPNSTIVLDLTLLDQNIATLSLDESCPTIHISLDTANLIKGELIVRKIKRELNKCSTALEDDLMAMISDTRSFNQENLINNTLTLNSFQDKLNFRPLEP